MKIVTKITFIVALLSGFWLPPSYSQTGPPIYWQNTIGGESIDWLNAVQPATDGGYLVGGYADSPISCDKTENSNLVHDYWIVKIDTAGNIQWQNTIGGTGYDWLYDILQTTDGGYILSGHSDSDISGDKTEDSNGGLDYWVVKINATGNIQWQNTIGGSGNEYLYAIDQTSDGGYILGGLSNSDISGDKTENTIGPIGAFDFWIVKLNASGNIQWQNTIGGGYYDQPYAIQQTTDGGYIVGGISASSISGDKTENCIGNSDYWIVKLNASGNIQWQNTIGGTEVDYLEVVQQTSDGGYILGGYSESNISGDKTENSWNNTADYWIVKIDSLGNIQWQNTIGGSMGESLFAILQTTDGGYLIGGASNSNISGDKTENSNGLSDYWIVKLNSLGNIQWQNNIGGSNYDQLYSILYASNGGYILGGFSRSDISGDKTEDNCDSTFYTPDFWVIKLGPDTITGISDFEFSISDFTIFPNPLTTQSTIAFRNPANEKFVFTLYDITGQPVPAKSGNEDCITTISDKIILEKGNKPPGVYLYSLTNLETGESKNGKIVISY